MSQKIGDITNFKDEVWGHHISAPSAPKPLKDVLNEIGFSSKINPGFIISNYELAEQDKWDEISSDLKKQGFDKAGIDRHVNFLKDSFHFQYEKIVLSKSISLMSSKIGDVSGRLLKM